MPIQMSAVPVARSVFLMTLSLMAGNVPLKIDTVSEEGASVQARANLLFRHKSIMNYGDLYTIVNT